MTEEKKADEVKSGSEDTVKMSADQIIKRRSRWQSSLAAMRYIDGISKDHEVKLRDTDRATSLALLVVCVFACLSMFLPQLSAHRLPLVGAADVLLGMTLMTHVANRFGIVTTLTPRQAVLVWQLMMGASLLGVFMAINLGIVICLVIAKSQIVIPR